VGTAERNLFEQRVQGILQGSIIREGGNRDVTRRVALVAFYNPVGQLTLSERKLLEELLDNKFTILVCQSTLRKLTQFQSQLSPFCHSMLFRTNAGRDFASWFALFKTFSDIAMKADFLLFCNDSFIGPVVPMSKVWEHHVKTEVDFYGLTESWESGFHTQSSFFILSKKAFNSPQFLNFMYGYGFPSQKEEIIVQGELGLSRALNIPELERRVFAPYNELAAKWLDRLSIRMGELMSYPECAIEHGVTYSDRRFHSVRRGHVDYALEWYMNVASMVREAQPLNPQHFFWREMVEDYGIPLIKRELVFQNPSKVPDIWQASQVIEARFGPGASRPLELDSVLLNSPNPPPVSALPRLSVQDLRAPDSKNVTSPSLASISDDVVSAR
jgi:hypothetical protein